MKHDKKQYQRILMGMLFVAASAAMVHGCTLEDLLEDFAVDSEGNYIGCRNLQQIMILRNDESTIVYYRDKNEGAFADVFAANVCPVAAPNCIYEWISDISDIEDSEEPNKQKGICNNCPSNYMLCKDKCVDISQKNLHIDDCILDYLTCKDDYYDFNDDSSDGCEFQLSRNHVINNQGNLVCAEDYFDLNQDLNNKDESDGCEFRLSSVNIDKTQPQNPDGSLNCIDGYADIDKNPYNGCEVNGWTDKAHCGAGIIDGDTRKTGVQCEDYEVCTRGTCMESCGEDYMLVCDSQCVNTKIDNAHCGGCNSPCSLTANDARAAVACQDGGCHAIACQPGYYLADADEVVGGKVLKTCKPCADGAYTTSATATECEECKTTTGAASMVFDVDNNICKAATCNAGYKLNDGSCEPCEPGTFSVAWGSGVTVNSCTACSENNFSGRAASSCTPCPAGTHTVGDDRTTCEVLECRSGYHVYVNSCEKDSTDNCGAPGNKCATLNNGTSACTNGQCVYKCHAGYYWKAEGCTDNKCCQSCPAGSYCPTAGLISPIPCTIGHYCPAKDSTECVTGTACAKNHPTACPMGTYRDQPNGTKEGDCSKCPKGRHNDGVGAYECALIPAGYVGVNCRDITNYNGCVQYTPCDDNNSAFKCSNMYGSKSQCVNGYCMDTTQTTSASCIVEHNACPATDCCNGACATNNDNCGTCSNKCTSGKTCKFSDNTWKCQ